MKNRDGLFLVTCLSMTVAMTWSYSVFAEYFAASGDQKSVVASVELKLRHERFAREMAEARLRDFSQEVAAILPPDSAQRLASNGYSLGKISASVRAPASAPIDLSGVQLERGKRFFSEEKYSDAVKTFEKLVKEFPTSPNAVEAYFLMGESSYLLRDEKRTVEVADLMISQYPENELTGFMLLRLGQVSEHNSHGGEAAEVYRVVQKNFKNKALVEQAQRLSSALEAE